MKKTINISLLILILLTLGSCLQNNGNVGDWYGRWKLTEMKIDGVTDTQYQGNIFWAFQTHVIQMKLVTGNDRCEERWGSWSDEDGNLILNFTYSESASPNPGEKWYAPFEETHIPANEISTLKILKKPGSKLELAYTTHEGKVITYYLTRW